MFAFSPEVVAQIQAQAEAGEAPTVRPVREEIVVEVEERHLPPMGEQMGHEPYVPPAWPEPFDESQFRSHLDALHARAMHVGSQTWPTYRQRVEWWCARYDAAQADNERMAQRLTFLQELAADCPVVGVPDPLRVLVMESRRGPWTPATDSRLDSPTHGGAGS